MREDHALRGLDGQPVPTAEELERSIAAARRLRSAAVHEYLRRMAARLRGLAQPAAAPKGPVGQCG
jgi:hypothetical protein